jgi:hypothetical protein
VSPPLWTRWLLGRLARPDRAVDALGDLEEAHRARVERRGRVLATVLTSLEAIDLAFAMLRARLPRRRPRGEPSRPRVAGRARGQGTRSCWWVGC